MKHIDVERRLVHQDTREVRTKRAKTFTTSFFPVGDDIEAIFLEWIDHLQTNLLLSDDDPLFPATQVALKEAGVFAAVGLERQHWTNATPIRRIFKNVFEAAGLTYFNPHSFRKTLVQLGERVCRTPEEFKAWSQSLGHEQVLTTFTSYGVVSGERQAEIMTALKSQQGTEGEDFDDLDDAAIERIVAAFRRKARAIQG